MTFEGQARGRLGHRFFHANPDELIEQAHNGHTPASPAQKASPPDDNEDLLAALGM